MPYVTKKELESAYDRGYNAYDNGNSRGSNPFDAHFQSELYRAWNDGWNDAEDYDLVEDGPMNINENSTNVHFYSGEGNDFYDFG